MVTRCFLPVSPSFNFAQTITSHGWYDLKPFSLDDLSMSLGYVFRVSDRPVSVRLRQLGDKVEVRLSERIESDKAVAKQVCHVLRLDENYEEFHDLCAGDSLAWVREQGAGRLLRSATVFEDLVKTMCTTNCSWGLTRKMVSNLVESLGEQTSYGEHAFPTAESMASRDESFYRNVVRAGYRAPYLAEIARAVALGKLDPETWLSRDLATAELKKQMKSVKGIGDYAAENMLKLLGRYDGLALDSWLRSQYFRKHNRGRRCHDKKIEAHYKKYGKWRGLAIWCDMTEHWHA